MELVEQTQNQETPTDENSSRKGGLKTLPFIIVNEAFEKVASYGIQPNLILYLINEYHYTGATGVTILSTWSQLHQISWLFLLLFFLIHTWEDLELGFHC